MIDLIHAPSCLGLRPSGVEKAPEALAELGLGGNVDGTSALTVNPPEYSQVRDDITGILNPNGIASYSRKLNDAVAKSLDDGRFPIVLGGDCSVLVGCAQAMAAIGRTGLFFLDGHQDFYLPSESPTGELADMDLAVVTGNSTQQIKEVLGLNVLFKSKDVVAFGSRDEHEVKALKAHRIDQTEMTYLPYSAVKADVSSSAKHAIDQVFANLSSVWLHFDVDVLSDDIMPAVDYRLSGGLSETEVLSVISALISTGKLRGMSVTIYNPLLDDVEKTAGRCVVSILNGAIHQLAQRAEVHP